MTEPDERWSPEYAKIWLALDCCTACGRRLRPLGTKPSEFPGTLGSNKEGLCPTDADKLRKAAKISLARDIARDNLLRSTPGGRGISLSEVALSWHPAERSAAELVAEHCAGDTDLCREFLAILGLDDPMRMGYSTVVQPHNF